MVTAIEIANLALGQLGAGPITSFTDKTVEARLARQYYPLVRDTVLEDHNWTFAIKRVGPLTPLSDKPAFQFEYAFPLPSDCLRVVLATWDKKQNYTRPQNLIFQVENNAIMTNMQPVYVKYIYRVASTLSFSPAFVDALTTRLAAEMALALTNNLNLQDQMYKLYGFKVQVAARSDGMQGTSQRMPPGSLVSLR